MNKKIFIYDPTASDKLSAVRGVGRYLQILRENFSDEFKFVSQIENYKLKTEDSVLINPFFNFLQKPLTLRRIASKQIAVIHDLIPLKYPSHFPAGIRGNINIFLNKIALKNYDLIITDSEASKADIIDILKIKNEKLKVIYPCLSKIFIESQNLKVNPPIGGQKYNSKIKSNKKTFNFSLLTSNFCIYVGDATWNKNLVNIAKAIKTANVSCVFVGRVFDQKVKVVSKESLREADCRDNRQSLAEEECRERLKSFSHPWQSELKQFLEETKNDKRFIFAGYIPDPELFELYERASVNLLLSHDEGFGFSYLEAANFSCPSLLSDIPVLKEISNNRALFADPSSPYNIADKINEIYFDKILRNKIGASAKKRAGYFSPEKFKKEFLSII